MVSHSKCPLCESPDIGHFLKCTDTLVSREEFDLSKCRSCGFIFTSAYPGQDEIGRYYESEDYISHSDSGRTFLDKIYQEARRMMLFFKRKMITTKSKVTGGKILDIGCGTGHFLNEMKAAGWETTGIEINSKAREYAISKFGLKVLSPDSLGSLYPGSYDCITLWHVLEHFHDPFGYFREIKRLLKPDGIVVIALPNSASYDAEHYGRNWAAYDVPRHLWHFSPDTFALLASKSGFRVVSQSVLPLDVFYISILSEKQKNPAFASLFGLTMGKLYFLCSLVDRKKGSSIVYTLKADQNQYLSR